MSGTIIVGFISLVWLVSLLAISLAPVLASRKQCVPVTIIKSEPKRGIVLEIVLANGKILCWTDHESPDVFAALKSKHCPKRGESFGGSEIVRVIAHQGFPPLPRKLRAVKL